MRRRLRMSQEPRKVAARKVGELMSGYPKREGDRSLKIQRQVDIITRNNVRLARENWAASSEQIASLRRLSDELQLSIAASDLILLEGKWYVTHAGLLRLAQRKRCFGMKTTIEKELS